MRSPRPKRPSRGTDSRSVLILTSSQNSRRCGNSVHTAGISRGSQFNGPPDPLARFGVVYFDEILAYSTNGTRLLTDGEPTTMVDANGSTLAIPQRLNDFAFKVIYRGN